MGFGGASSAKVEELIAAAHLVTDALVTTVDGVADAVKLKTDGLPADPASESGAIKTETAAIKAKTDGLPADPASESGAIKTETALIKAKTDGLPADPADQSELEDDLSRKYTFMDFWSAPADKLTLDAAADDLDFPNILVSGLPAGATYKRVVLMMTCRAILDTSAAANYIDEASKTLRVKKSASTWGNQDLVGITFDINSLYCAASTKEPGPVIIGAHDVKGEVNGDATYNVRSDETTRSDAISAFADSLELYDIQVGLRFFFE